MLHLVSYHSTSNFGGYIVLVCLEKNLKFPSFYQGNWSDDNIKVRKRNKATSWSHNWQYVLLPYYKKKGVKPEFIEQIKDSYYHQIQFAPGKKQTTNLVLRRCK